MRPVRATPAQEQATKVIVKDQIETSLLRFRDTLNMEPISGACIMTDALIFSVAEVNRPAAIAYFRATLDAVELAGTPQADAAYQRRDAAFDQLAQTVMLSRQTGGHA